MNLKINQKLFQLGGFTLSIFLLLISAAKVFSSTPDLEIERQSLSSVEASPQEWPACEHQGENWSEVKYVESQNYFANICHNSQKQLTLIAGAKSNPSELLKLPVRAGQGYVAFAGNKTFMIDNSFLSLVVDGMLVKKEQVTYKR